MTGMQVRVKSHSGKWYHVRVGDANPSDRMCEKC